MRGFVMLLLGGCASFGGMAKDADTGSADGTGLAEDSGFEEPVEDLEGRWWSLDADLVVSDGAVVAASSELRFTLQEDAEEVCTDVVTPSAVTAVEQPPHPDVLVWLQVEWASASLTCIKDGAPSAGAMLLGVGLMDPEIEALIGRLEEATADSADSLNASYATVDGDDRLFVFGAAGPQASWQGDGDPLAAAPLTDGLWMVRAVYSFTLPE